MNNKEEILCVRRERLPLTWVGWKTAVRMEVKDCFDALKEAGCVFLPRHQVENDPQYKQIIPYIIVQEKERHAFASYKRIGGETRLHDLTSCGIGGHVGRQDEKRGAEDLKGTIFRGLARELAEEFIILPRIESMTFLGVINEDETPVGSVHLGLVFLLEVRSQAGIVPGPELSEFTWLARKDLETRQLELWSRLALTFLDEK
ncbi:MAG TPA: hypothetical protein PLT64_06420 [Syntrophales bacterium]|nr:hypothetical protein [Syntrophales bacterium]HOL59490.1 hypothetical protein [Syntrophales bacterium]HPO34672.1 hypothetical protein [Syntrophales bacterium]